MVKRFQVLKTGGLEIRFRFLVLLLFSSSVAIIDHSEIS